MIESIVVVKRLFFLKIQTVGAVREPPQLQPNIICPVQNEEFYSF